MKADVYRLNKSPVAVWEENLTCRANPGFTVTLRVRRLGQVATIEAFTLAEEFMARHFGDGPDVVPLPPVGDEPVIVTTSTARILAIVERAQVPTDPDDRYTMSELVHMVATSDDLGEQILALSDKILEPGEQADPLARES